MASNNIRIASIGENQVVPPPISNININNDSNSISNSKKNASQNILNRLIFRAVQPTDMPRCYQIEKASYPPDEAASKSQLQYRQHHAAPFFRCAFLIDDGGSYDSAGNSNSTDSSNNTHANNNSDNNGTNNDLNNNNNSNSNNTNNITVNESATTDTRSSVSYQGRSASVQNTIFGSIIGFVCSTRTASFNAEAMKTHQATGPLLAIHSVVVEEKYRRMGVASAMIHDYILAMERLNRGSSLKVKMEKIVLLAKTNLLGFYVRNGFRAMGVSEIVHGKEEWFELERDMKKMEEDENEEKEKVHECFIVDSFADVEKEGSGNPAAVVLLNGAPGNKMGVKSNAKKSQVEEEDDDTDNSLDEITNVEDTKLVSTMDSNAKVSDISPRGLEWMGVVAKEFNLSETAFVWPMEIPNYQDITASPISGYAIRYYTKTGVEVNLCGHATLAAAAVLLSSKKVVNGGGGGNSKQSNNSGNNGNGNNSNDGNKITFIAKYDVLHAELLVPPSSSSLKQSLTSISLSSGGASSANASRIAMNFPWKNVTPISSGKESDQVAILDMFSRAFFGASYSSSGSQVESALTSRFLKFFSGQDSSSSDPFSSNHVLHIGTTDGEEDLFLELTEEGFDLLRGITVDYGALARGWGGYSRGVIICCCASQLPTADSITPVDFRSRFFGPKVGIDEDPVTGSAHCSLGPYFGAKLGKTTVVGRQESERSGLVECTMRQEEGRVSIVGRAVTTVSGKLMIGI